MAHHLIKNALYQVGLKDADWFLKRSQLGKRVRTDEQTDRQ